MLKETEMSLSIKAMSLDNWLNKVDYGYLNSNSYIPTVFALKFINFIKLANGAEGESHKTPPMHAAMLDRLELAEKRQIVNLLFRGAAKTTLFGEYMILFIAAGNELPKLGLIDGLIYVSDSMENGVKSLKNNIKFRYENSPFLMAEIPDAHFTDKYLEFKNKYGNRLGVKMFGAQTGIRGTKIFGKRPRLAILDDLLSDDDAKSPTALKSIKDTIYKGITHALDPVNRMTIFNGTPFNKEDPIVQAVESGEWEVNVWPVCETFPCSREEFRGAWPSRFTFDFIQEQFDLAQGAGTADSFFQELMLRITTDDEKLVQDKEIRYYSRQELLRNIHNFNRYITTDFATSKKQTADLSVIAGWGYNAQGDWFLIDAVAARQTIDKTINDLFSMVQSLSPLEVGIEVSGQQGAFITILQKEMMSRNLWFNFASSTKTGEPGIRPTVDKLTRFNLVVPLFRAGKVYFPEELKGTETLNHFISQIGLATKNGIKGKDDCLDAISQLQYINAWKPAQSSEGSQSHDPLWDSIQQEPEPVGLDSYIC